MFIIFNKFYDTFITNVPNVSFSAIILLLYSYTVDRCFCIISRCLAPHSRYSDRSRNRKEYETSARKITGVALRSFGPARSVLFVYGSPVDGKEQPETHAAAQSVFAQVDGRRVQFKRGDRASLGEIQEYRIGY